MPYLEITYHFIVTTAPIEYDYGYTVPLDGKRVDVDTLPIDVQENLYYAREKGAIVRSVMVPVDRTDYQTCRYQSGLYFTHIVEI